MGIVTSEPESELSQYFNIRVDRSKEPIYPEWFAKLDNPELKFQVPSEYDLREVVPWLHPEQAMGVVRGQVIYEYLKKNAMLASCLNLQDGIVIQQKYIRIFRELFRGKSPFLWGSVVEDKSGYLAVPYLCDYNDTVIVSWYWLDSLWASHRPALRFWK